MLIIGCDFHPGFQQIAIFDNLTGEMREKRLQHRTEAEQFYRGLAGQQVRVGMEACGGAHYWARELRALGHEVFLLPPQYVKAYVKRGKNDRADAEAICEAMSRPTMRFVPVKTVEDVLKIALVRQPEAIDWVEPEIVATARRPDDADSVLTH